VSKYGGKPQFVPILKSREALAGGKVTLYCTRMPTCESALNLILSPIECYGPSMQAFVYFAPG
jgi:hypothetical protein